MCAVKAFSCKSTHKSHTFRTKGPKDTYFLVDETLTDTASTLSSSVLHEIISKTEELLEHKG